MNGVVSPDISRADRPARPVDNNIINILSHLSNLTRIHSEGGGSGEWRGRVLTLVEPIKHSKSSWWLLSRRNLQFRPSLLNEDFTGKIGVDKMDDPLRINLTLRC